MNRAERTHQLLEWIKNYIPVTAIVPIQGDASPRRYFRITSESESFIGVDSPIDSENNIAFISIAEALRKYGINAPEIYQADLAKGFLLLQDLGDRQLLKILSDATVDHYYEKAFKQLLQLQQCKTFENYTLPTFNDEALLVELTRFDEWYLSKHLALSLLPDEVNLLQELYSMLIREATTQRYVFVHRDYHSRNLMVLMNDELGIIDFQDAVYGPITYDLVSLLRDCYIKWPVSKVYEWVDAFWHELPLDYKTSISSLEFAKQFDWMGLQRHLKVLGIFARLYLRDQKSDYLADIPRILSYVLYICNKYSEFEKFKHFLTTRVLCHESDDFSGRQRNSAATLNG